MNALKSLVKFQQSSRQFVTTSVNRRTMQEFKELQRQMQVDDGVPMYLKKGPIDKLIFRLIALGVAGTTLYSLAFIKSVIYPPPPS